MLRIRSCAEYDRIGKLLTICLLNPFATFVKATIAYLLRGHFNGSTKTSTRYHCQQSPPETAERNHEHRHAMHRCPRWMAQPLMYLNESASKPLWVAVVGPALAAPPDLRSCTHTHLSKPATDPAMRAPRAPLPRGPAEEYSASQPIQHNPPGRQRELAPTLPRENCLSITAKRRDKFRSFSCSYAMTLRCGLMRTLRST